MPGANNTVLLIIGIALGVAAGAALNNIAVGTGCGAAFGVALMAIAERRRRS